MNPRLMKRRTGPLSLLVATALLAGWAPTLEAQAPDPDPGRFSEQFAQFARWDAKNYVPEDAVLFVGSSSIVRWNTAESFPGMPLINRGFGGSQISDVVHYVEEAVLKYNPAVVVHYAGDNDTSAGKSPQQIFEDYREFALAVLAHDAATEVVFLTIKPSLSRWSVWPQMQAANALVKTFSESRPNLHYVDVGTPMLGSDGEPIPGLFVRDGLHMTPAGYDIWTDVVGRALAALHN